MKKVQHMFKLSVSTYIVNPLETNFTLTGKVTTSDTCQTIGFCPPTFLRRGGGQPERKCRYYGDEVLAAAQLIGEFYSDVIFLQWSGTALRERQITDSKFIEESDEKVCRKNT